MFKFRVLLLLSCGLFVLTHLLMYHVVACHHVANMMVIPIWSWKLHARRMDYDEDRCSTSSASSYNYDDSVLGKWCIPINYRTSELVDIKSVEWFAFRMSNCGTVRFKCFVDRDRVLGDQSVGLMLLALVPVFPGTNQANLSADLCPSTSGDFQPATSSKLFAGILHREHNEKSGANNFKMVCNATIWFFNRFWFLCDQDSLAEFIQFTFSSVKVLCMPHGNTILTLLDMFKTQSGRTLFHNAIRKKCNVSVFVISPNR